jgi:hypothetical protein
MPPAPRQWNYVGDATVGADREPKFPIPTFRRECIVETKVSGTTKKKVPGIYRLTFDKDRKKYVWIGQSDDLLRCPFKDYCKPSDGVEKEHVLHDILVDAGGARIEVIPECDLLPKGIKRHAAELEEQNMAIENQLLLNRVKKRRGLGYGHYLKFKKEYHKRMFEKTKEDLQSWEREHSTGG